MTAPAGPAIARVREEDLPDLLPLMAAYLAFYERSAEPAALEGLCRALLADPVHEGVQVLARGPDRSATGFATVYWTWSTTRPGRLAVMNDLYVDPAARGTGVADALIAACRDLAREHGARALSWMTAPGNRRARAVYDRSGATASSWLEYELEVDG
jgi:GNAT superfamily N-acetyltransferase